MYQPHFGNPPLTLLARSSAPWYVFWLVDRAHFCSGRESGGLLSRGGPTSFIVSMMELTHRVALRPVHLVCFPDHTG